MAIDMKALLEKKRTAALESVNSPVQPQTMITNHSILQTVPSTTIKKIDLTAPVSPVNNNASQSNPHSHLGLNMTLDQVSGKNAVNKDSDMGSILEKVGILRQAILDVHPNLPNFLNDIWKILKADQNTVTLLSEEDIGVICQGAQIATNTKIIEHTSPKSRKKKVATADDV